MARIAKLLSTSSILLQATCPNWLLAKKATLNHKTTCAPNDSKQLLNKCLLEMLKHIAKILTEAPIDITLKVKSKGA